MRFEIKRTDNHEPEELIQQETELHPEDTLTPRDRAAYILIQPEQGSPLFRFTSAGSGLHAQLPELLQCPLPSSTYFLVERPMRDLLRRPWWNFTYTFPMHHGSEWGEFQWWAPLNGVSHTKEALFRDATVVESLFRHRYWDQLTQDPQFLRQPAQYLQRIILYGGQPLRWERTVHHLRTDDTRLQSTHPVLSGKNEPPTR